MLKHCAKHNLASAQYYIIFHHIDWLVRCATSPYMLTGNDVLFIVGCLSEEGLLIR